MASNRVCVVGLNFETRQCLAQRIAGRFHLNVPMEEERGGHLGCAPPPLEKVTSGYQPVGAKTCAGSLYVLIVLHSSHHALIRHEKQSSITHYRESADP